MTLSPGAVGPGHDLEQPRTASRRPGGHSAFRPDIEGLRGVAVLLVVLYHVGIPGLRGGFTGVDVFFVLSGYLITNLLVQEAMRTGRVDFVQFYARRTRRLLPAAVLVLAVTLVAGAWVFSPLEQLTFTPSAIATAAYASNLQFMHQAADYFAADSASDPFLHTWSLAVEEQFYLVWPMLIALGLSAGRRRGRLVALVAAVCAISFVACTWFTVGSRHWAFFGSPLRAWEFGLGGLATLLPLAWLEARRAWATALGWAGLTLILVAGVAITGSMRFPGPLALVPVLGTVAALIGCSAAPGTGATRPLGSRPMQALGRLSYSWYLWHWPVLVMATALVPTLSLAGRLAAAAGALGLAALTFALVENPIRFHRSLVPRPRRSLAFAAGLTVVALGLALGARQRLTVLHASEPYKAILAATEDEPSLRGCMLGFTGRHLRECVFGDTASATTVVLFGDSHAAHWFPAVEYAAHQHGWRLVTLLKAACATANVPVYNQVAGGRDDICDGWRRAALRRIDALRPTAVVLSNSQGYVIRPGREDGYSMLSDSQWESGSRQTFQRLHDAAARVIYLRDSPRPLWDIPICLSRAAQRGQDASVCTADRGVAVDPHVFDAERRAAADLSRISMLDLSDLFCGPEQCEPVREGLVVYRDHSHLTSEYVHKIAPRISERLAAAMPPEELSRR